MPLAVVDHVVVFVNVSSEPRSSFTSRADDCEDTERAIYSE